MKLEDTLNGGYKGLYGEVVTHDIYRLRTLPFTPDLIYDIGANIGVFTRFARSLWPDAYIVAVEPHQDNVEQFYEHTAENGSLKKIELLRAALGKGQLWHNLGAPNGAHESYVSTGLGFDEIQMSIASNTERSEIPTIMLNELIDHTWYKEGMKTVCKVDCEGGENCLWDDRPSMEALKKMDYICMEVHWYALTGGLAYDEVKAATLKAIEELKETHVCELDNVTFWAIKKEYATTI